MLQQLTKREHTFSSQKGYEKGLYRVEQSQSYANPASKQVPTRREEEYELLMHIRRLHEEKTSLKIQKTKNEKQEEKRKKEYNNITLKIFKEITTSSQLLH
jgi:hypothetical protein